MSGLFSGSIIKGSDTVRRNKMKWQVLCNGGPNNTTVGMEKDSLGKAIGSLESMMQNLNATIEYIQRVDKQRKIEDGVFVGSEKEAEGSHETIDN